MFERYWEVNPEPPGLSIEHRATRWPDVLGTGNGAPGFFVSDRMVESLRLIGAPMGRVTEMPIAESEGWTNIAFQRLRLTGINPFTGLPE